MRIGILQSNYIPWRGYFDFIDSVDVFVFYDRVQYTSRDWRNRNRIKTKKGPIWLTVPVKHIRRNQSIEETVIDQDVRWKAKHILSVKHAYKKTPYFEGYFPQYQKIIEEDWETISELNQKLIQWVMNLLNIRTVLLSSFSLARDTGRTENLLAILKQLGATSYLSGPAAAAYLDIDLFRQANISLAFKNYDYAPYPQLHGAFVPDVSVLDLLFNMGPAAREYLKSRTPDKVVVTGDQGDDNPKEMPGLGQRSHQGFSLVGNSR